jgi:hypothetical protein
VLGSQFLTDLRDNICCLTDKLMKVAGQHDHSGYFLIEVCFSFLFFSFLKIEYVSGYLFLKNCG